LKQILNIQDTFLNQLRKEDIPVTVYLINGFQIKGLVKGFDSFTIIIESDNKQQMIYKHAISTFIPQKAMPLVFEKLIEKETLKDKTKKSKESEESEVKEQE